MSDFLKKMPRFIALEAVGPSAVRGQRQRTRETVVGFLQGMDLSKIPNTDQPGFGEWLDDQTETLRRTLPDPAKPWGLARKTLNLFLRACCYNYYLRREYDLAKIEQWLEIPLDSVVSRYLKRKAGRGHLPAWASLRQLMPEESAQFQLYALEDARVLGLPARVHLDLYAWLDNR